jgi:cell fate regulator YaaT (PSP1 superfamily)
MAEINQTKTETKNEYTHFVGVKFLNTPRAYFFGVKDIELQIGDQVVVETVRGTELGTVAIEAISIEKYSNGLLLKPIIRKATDTDIKLAEINQKDAVFAMEICQNEVKKLNLDMNLISCEYTLDKSKVLFSYLADDRVDFRELLKVLASRLHTRIELRQIGSRDKAKMIGGLGVCGLPLCCSTFLNEFDGISINRAKNQMLAINIPKLSGQCGKLICCLKYEDDAYTEERKKFPDLGSRYFIDKVEYTVTSVNILSRIVKIENPDDVKFIPLDDFAKQTGFNKRREHRNDKK